MDVFTFEKESIVHRETTASFELSQIKHMSMCLATVSHVKINSVLGGIWVMTVEKKKKTKRDNPLDQFVALGLLVIVQRVFKQIHGAVFQGKRGERVS